MRATGRNRQLPLPDLLRQSIDIRLATTRTSTMPSGCPKTRPFGCWPRASGVKEKGCPSAVISGRWVLVTKESGGQKDTEGGEHPASQDIGSVMVAEVQCRKDHDGDRGEGAAGQARRESKHVVDADQGGGDVAAGEGVALDSLHGVEEVPDRFGDKETGEFRSVRG